MKYDVVISFASENRDIVEPINDCLKNNNIKTFYDNDYEPFLWGKFLSEELSNIYSKEGKYCLMIISKFYIKKCWPRHERRTAISRQVREEGEYVLPYIVDDTQICDVPGLSDDFHYLHINKTSPFRLVYTLINKLYNYKPLIKFEKNHKYDNPYLAILDLLSPTKITRINAAKFLCKSSIRFKNFHYIVDEMINVFNNEVDPEVKYWLIIAIIRIDSEKSNSFINTLKQQLQVENDQYIIEYFTEALSYFEKEGS